MLTLHSDALVCLGGTATLGAGLRLLPSGRCLIARGGGCRRLEGPSSGAPAISPHHPRAHREQEDRDHDGQAHQTADVEWPAAAHCRAPLLLVDVALAFHR